MKIEQQRACASLRELLDEWDDEHRELDRTIQQLVDWVCGEGSPEHDRLKGITYRLRQLQLRLEEHFDKEHRLGKLLADARGASTMEIDAVCRRAAAEHSVLAERLARLIAGVERGAFASWNDVAAEFDLLVDRIEQHEEQERQSVQWLLPLEQCDGVKLSQTQ